MQSKKPTVIFALSIYLQRDIAATYLEHLGRVELGHGERGGASVYNI